MEHSKTNSKPLGYEAKDFDILNDFGETDEVIDLFEQIELAYDNEESIFDDMNEDDLILAFFPCTRFENQILLHFRGQATQMQNYYLAKKTWKRFRIAQRTSSFIYTHYKAGVSLFKKRIKTCNRKSLFRATLSS